MNTTPAFVDLDTTAPVQLTANAWNAMNTFAPQAVNYLLKASVRAGLWESIHHSIAGGCVHGEYAKDRFDTLIAAAIEEPRAGATVRQWIQALDRGVPDAEGTWHTLPYLQQLYARALDHTVGAEGAGVLTTISILMEAGARPSKQTLQTALDRHASEILDLLLTSLTSATGSMPKEDQFGAMDDTEAEHLLLRAVTQSIGWGTEKPYECARILIEALTHQRPQVASATMAQICTLRPASSAAEVGGVGPAAVLLALSGGAGEISEERKSVIDALIAADFPHDLPQVTLLRGIYAGAVQALVHEGGWDINTPSPAGMTLLQSAAGAGQTDLVLALLEFAPDSTIEVNQGQGTAKDLAYAAGHDDLALLLAAYAARQSLANVARGVRLESRASS
jgi:hypothetical protein